MYFLFLECLSNSNAIMRHVAQHSMIYQNALNTNQTKSCLANSKIGGRGLSEYVCNVLVASISCKLASSNSLYGKQGKKEFSSQLLCRVIIRKYRLFHNSKIAVVALFFVVTSSFVLIR